MMPESYIVRFGVMYKEKSSNEDVEDWFGHVTEGTGNEICASSDSTNLASVFM